MPNNGVVFRRIRGRVVPIKAKKQGIISTRTKILGVSSIGAFAGSGLSYIKSKRADRNIHKLISRTKSSFDMLDDQAMKTFKKSGKITPRFEKNINKLVTGMGKTESLSKKGARLRKISRGFGKAGIALAGIAVASAAIDPFIALLKAKRKGKNE